jgi:hypothetical protein
LRKIDGWQKIAGGVPTSKMPIPEESPGSTGRRNTGGVGRS